MQFTMVILTHSDALFSAGGKNLIESNDETDSDT